MPYNTSIIRRPTFHSTTSASPILPPSPPPPSLSSGTSSRQLSPELEATEFFKICSYFANLEARSHSIKCLAAVHGPGSSPSALSCRCDYRYRWPRRVCLLKVFDEIPGHSCPEQMSNKPVATTMRSEPFLQPAGPTLMQTKHVPHVVR